MLQIRYCKVIPYPFEAVLDQYFDYEHIAIVHPTTLGEYVLVEATARRIVYDQRWPADRRGRRATSRVVQTFQPPGEIRFEFTAGKHRGTKVHSLLQPHPHGTEVTEAYYLPWLPNWGWLRRLIEPSVIRQVDRIWDEDLRVGVCIGGWPGVPGQASRVDAAAWRRPLAPGSFRVGPIADFPVGSLTAVHTPGGTVLIAHTTTGVRALHPSCPHTGGPLALGTIDKGCVVCPWHAARFDVATGQAVAGPTRVGLPAYAVRMEDKDVIVEA